MMDQAKTLLVRIRAGQCLPPPVQGRRQENDCSEVFCTISLALLAREIKAAALGSCQKHCRMVYAEVKSVNSVPKGG